MEETRRSDGRVGQTGRQADRQKLEHLSVPPLFCYGKRGAGTRYPVPWFSTSCTLTLIRPYSNHTSPGVNNRARTFRAISRPVCRDSLAFFRSRARNRRDWWHVHAADRSRRRSGNSSDPDPSISPGRSRQHFVSAPLLAPSHAYVIARLAIILVRSVHAARAHHSIGRWSNGMRRMSRDACAYCDPMTSTRTNRTSLCLPTSCSRRLPSRGSPLLERSCLLR